MPPTDSETLTELHSALSALLRQGAARPAILTRRAAEPLRELLTPPGALEDRAVSAHAQLVTAVEVMGEPEHEAARILFCLRPGDSPPPLLVVRRRLVGELYDGKEPGTVRHYYEPFILDAVALELARRIPPQVRALRPPPPIIPPTNTPLRAIRIPPPRDLGPTKPPDGPQAPPRHDWP